MRQREGRSGRGSRRLAAQFACALVLLAVPATFPAASAAFSTSTGDGGNSVSAGTVSPPSGLSATTTCASGPGIALRSSSSAGSGDVVLDTVTIPMPAGVAAGDLLLAQVSNRQGAYTLNAPAGWTAIRRETAGSTSGTQVTSALLWKVAGASEGSATFTLGGLPNVQMVGGIAAYTGVHATSPIHASGAGTGISTTATAPSVTTTVANTRLVQLFTKRQELLPAPSGTAQLWRLLSGTGATNVGATGAESAFAGPGASPARAATSASAFEWVAQTVALRPAMGAPSASLSWTASPTSAATGYRLERSVGGTVQNTATVTPVSTTSTTDGPLVNGTAYTFRLWAYRGTWSSTAITAGLTPSC